MKIEFNLSTLLTIVFVILKLCKVISWSWWWVFSPIWLVIAFILIHLIFLILRLIVALIKAFKE